METSLQCVGKVAKFLGPTRWVEYDLHGRLTGRSWPSNGAARRALILEGFECGVQEEYFGAFFAVFRRPRPDEACAEKAWLDACAAVDARRLAAARSDYIARTGYCSCQEPIIDPGWPDWDGNCHRCGGMDRTQGGGA